MTQLQFIPAQRRTAMLRLAGLCGLAVLPRLTEAGYNIWTQTYTVEQAEIGARLASHFPLTLRPSQWLAAELSDPIVALHPPQSRLSVATRIRIISPLLTRIATGSFTIQSGLRYHAEDRTLRLHEPDTERLALDALSQRDNQNLQIIASSLAREALHDYPLHTFTPEELRYGNRSFEPGEITVTSEGIAVQRRPV